MEDELCGIRLAGCMTVDAHARHLGVLDDGILIEGREVALVEPHLTIDLIAWGDTAIGQAPFVKGVGTDVDLEVLILFPLTVLPDADGEGQLSAFVRGRQLMPVLNVEIGEITLCMQISSLRATDHDINHVNISSCDIEIQWGDFCGYRHSDIVGIDSGGLIQRDRVLHPLGAGRPAYEGTKVP